MGWRGTGLSGAKAVILLGWSLSNTDILAQTALSPRTAAAPEWTSLFQRKEGWTGADGIFAIPLSGYEAPGRASQGKTLFVFSDTFIGPVDSAGKRYNSTMVNNTLAVLDGARPDATKIRFLWGKAPDGKPAAAFTPKTPKTLARQAAGTRVWYWLQDGFVHKGNFYNLPLIVEYNPEGAEGWQFQETGIALIKVPLGADGEPDLSKSVQFDTPLHHVSGGRSVYFGCGILVNTAEAGAPNPDGYVYVYGRNGLYVSRVLPDDIEDFSKWRFWDGSGWNADIGKSASLGLGGPELSVMPVPDGVLKGKYLLTSSGLEPDIFVRVGDHPWGPFGNRINVFKAPEWNTQVPIYTYNAKAHPSLSADGTWLVTYNVNTSNWNENLAKADIYRPRFFALRFDPGVITGIAGNPMIQDLWTAKARPMASRGGFRFSGWGMPAFGGAASAVSTGDGDLPILMRADGRALRLIPR